MNPLLRAALSAALLSASAAVAQMPMPPATSGPASEVQLTYTRLKPNIIKAAEKMPEADFQFKPTPEIRSFARVVNHITEAQFHTCTTLNGSRFDPKAVPPETADKTTIVAALKASFEECDKAYAALTDANMAEPLTMGPMKRSRLGLAWGNVSHDNEQYAELSTYLRLKNIVPPTSEK
jgi:hypothetical protein